MVVRKLECYIQMLIYSRKKFSHMFTYVYFRYKLIFPNNFAPSKLKERLRRNYIDVYQCIYESNLRTNNNAQNSTYLTGLNKVTLIPIKWSTKSDFIFLLGSYMQVLTYKIQVNIKRLGVQYNTSDFHAIFGMLIQ